MSAFVKFDPRAFRDSSGAKAANPAKAGPAETSLSHFSRFSRGRPDPTQAGTTHPDQRNGGSWSAEDWQAYVDERADIAEFEGGLARVAAEARAFESCVCEWLNRNPAPSRPGRCVWCGQAGNEGALILPFGLEPSGHNWLHHGCWADWHQRRRAQATAALFSMGIKALAGLLDDFDAVGGA